MSQAVLLACEDGRRLYPLTQDCPAPLLPVLNTPLLHYQLELLEKAGYTGAAVEALAETIRLGFALA